MTMTQPDTGRLISRADYVEPMLRNLGIGSKRQLVGNSSCSVVSFADVKRLLSRIHAEGEQISFGRWQHQQGGGSHFEIVEEQVTASASELPLDTNLCFEDTFMLQQWYFEYLKDGAYAVHLQEWW